MKTIQTGTDITKAANLLLKGELVALPTETVYGLGADASSQSALSKLYRAKGRPTNHPVIVHIHDLSQLEDWVENPTKRVFALAKAFWPGPLTLILKKKSTVLDQVTGGQDTVAIRIPNHPLTLKLLKEVNTGIAAPSANKFGHISPTCAKHVDQEFDIEVAYILDGGPCSVGIESTILDLTGSCAQILRPGQITREEIAIVLNEEVKSRFEGKTVPDEQLHIRVPGALKSHYSPLKPLYLVESKQLGNYLDELQEAGIIPGVIAFNQSKTSKKAVFVVASNIASVYASELYKSLRELDNSNCQCIIVEAVPEESQWSGIRDRLTRASRQENIGEILKMTEHKSIMLELKESTKPMHDSAEQHEFQRLLARGELNHTQYKLYLQQLYLMHKKVAEGLSSHRSKSKIIDSVLKDRHTSLSALTEDLANLEIEPSSVNPLKSTTELINKMNDTEEHTPEGLLGVLYVLEGSTHGAKYMVPTLRKGMNLEDRKGSSYFDRYQDKQMTYWLEFKKDMNEQPLEPKERELILDFAKATFETFGHIGSEILHESKRLATS